MATKPKVASTGPTGPAIPPAPAFDTGSTGGLAGGLTSPADVQSALTTPGSGAYAFWHQDDGKKIDPSRPVWQQTLSGFLAEAQKQGWLGNALSFQKNFRQTDWFAANKDQGLLYATSKFINNTYPVDIQNRSAEIKQLATEMGYGTLSDSVIQDLADKSLFQAYDSNAFGNAGYQQILKSKIALAAQNGGTQGITGATGALGTGATGPAVAPLGGTALDNINSLKTYAQQMGIAHVDSWYQNAVNQINNPQSGLTINDFMGQIKDQAKLDWSGYADKIDKGFKVSDIVSPYINSMARILEIDPNAVDISTDPYIKKAAGLTVGPDGTSQPMPTWQFENLLRQDPKWLQTNNARDSLMSTGLDFLKSFGLAN